jgi:hypothetical protein
MAMESNTGSRIIHISATFTRVSRRLHQRNADIREELNVPYVICESEEGQRN